MKFRLVESFDEDEFMSNEEELLFENYLFEMSNVRGKTIKIENIDFSFYFSSKEDANNQHGIRVKISWNREKVSSKLLDGYMELHGEYKYKSRNKPNTIPNEKDKNKAREFFKKYKVLFAAVWEDKLDQNDLVAYLREMINFENLLNNFESITEEQKKLITQAKDLKDLEMKVRENNIFNMND